MSILESKYCAHVAPSPHKLHRVKPLSFNTRSDLITDPVEVLQTTAVNVCDDMMTRLVDDLELVDDLYQFVREQGMLQHFEYWQTINRLKKPL
jgi:hypothetical protein